MTAVRKELRRRRRPLGLVTAFVALAAVLVFAFGASANLPTSPFEGGDGNFVVNTAGNTDWQSLNNNGDVTTGVDLLSGQTDNSFGNGTKESDVNVTVGTGSIPNSKADLGNFYVANETLANGHVLIYLGWTRVNTSGTTNFDFEINKLAQPDLTTSGPKTLMRSAGDIIVNYDFLGGAQKPTLAFRTWQANGTWSGPTPLGGTSGEAEVNRVSLTNPLAQLPSPATAPAFTFGEAAIDLTAAGIVGAGDCAPFSSAYVKSRASDAFTSAIKDFIAPVHVSLDNCGSITVIKHTNPRGLDKAFGYTATGGLDPATFSLNDDGNEGGGDSSGNTQVYSDLLPGTYTITEDSPDPTGFAFADLDCDGGGADTTIDDRTATIGLDAGEDVTCTYVNDQQLGAIKVIKTSSKTGNALAGATFSIAGESVVTGDDGTACVEDLTFGNYDVSETDAPTGFAIDDDSVHSVGVSVNQGCDDIAVADAVSFTDTPLADVQVRFRDGGSGETALVQAMTCDNVTGEPNDEDTLDWDDTHTVEGVKIDGDTVTVTCEIVIDP
jgi:Prealbumin-like fold domain